jgi:hypothetical protein
VSYTDTVRVTSRYALLAALAAAAGLAGCASRGATPQPFPGAAPPGPEPPREITAPAGATAAPEVSLLLDTALSLRGVPYRNLPRETRDQFGVGAPVATDDLRPGDLVFFETVRSGASHVGIVLDREWFVHAPSSNGVVRVERYSSRYWTTRYVGARRIE